MKFQNDKGQPVEINFDNFERILGEQQFGVTPVKFKSGKVEWIKASADEILTATAEE